MLPSQRRRIIRPAASALPAQAEEDGRPFSQADRDVATRMMNTYEAERRRHLGMTRSDAACDPNRFSRDLDDVPAMKRRGWDRGREENVEDDPSNTGGGEKRPPAVTAWLRAAQIVVGRRLDPETFVRRQFALVPPGGRPPVPGMFVTDLALTNYYKGLEVNRRGIETAARTQAACFETEVSALARGGLRLRGEPAWALVLDDLESPLTALFRYCAAVSIAAETGTRNRGRFREIAGRFKTAAALQYVFDLEAYDAVWKSRIPRGFRAEAEAIYDRTHGLPTAAEHEEFQ